MMILALGLRRAEEADHAVRVKGRRCATQGAFCQTGLLRPFSWRNAVQDDGANLFLITAVLVFDTTESADDNCRCVLSARVAPLA